MEPQQRLLMAYAWKAVEDAGYSAQSLSGTQTGVFIGTGNTGYSSLLANADIEGTSAANMSPSAGPNRVSYFMNLHGPSVPIDTACSSSLVAIHNAARAIEDGTCEMAIAGGVNTLVTPQGHIAYDKAGALSKEGRCKTFSNNADGFAASEGAGILFLKRLSAAERDGDHIYGVIRGTAVNHGGRANSLTTPNPKAQSELLQTAYTKAGIDPRTVTYIEAHGTGTSLGDPIEVNGLKSAFQELYRKTGDSEVLGKHCGLGSVKTNIGHLSLAAGVAGVIKILLQLKHKTLAKSLHCDTLNPYIQLENSPFYIVRETQEWKALTDAQGRELPRRAGVSSFGIGGVNAHVVIEEYVPKEEVPAMLDQPVALVWSARNEERLQEQARQALQSIVEGRYTDRDLTRMAYTLQVGREAMEERLGILAASMPELQEKLEGYLAGGDSLEDVYRGRVDKGAMHTLTADEDIQEAVGKWMQRRKYSKILEFWVKGLNVDWVQLYGTNRPRRIPLPTYPFAKEHYWADGGAGKTSENVRSLSVTNGLAPAAVLHPLLHRNISDLTEQRFSSTFTGQEFFLADHKVMGNPVLPGVAYLEMAREALMHAVREAKHYKGGLRIRNMVWIQPLTLSDGPLQTEICLEPQDNGEIAFEIYRESASEEGERIVHGQGSMALGLTEEQPLLDLKSLLSQCSSSTLTSRQCYEIFNSMGIDYGPGHRGIESVYIGQDQSLAKLSLPASLADTADTFVLHPSLLDSALQAVIGVRMDNAVEPLSLPFALHEVEIFGACTPSMWAYVRRSDGVAKQDAMQRLNIDLADEQGLVRVRIKGIASRALEGGGPPRIEPRQIPSELTDEPADTGHLLTPVWDTLKVERHRPFPALSDRVLVVGGDDIDISRIREMYPEAQGLHLHPLASVDTIAGQMEDLGFVSHIVWMAPSLPAGDQFREENWVRSEDSVMPVFRFLKALLRLGYASRKLSWTVVTERSQLVLKHDLVNPAHAGIHGFMGSAAKEFGDWDIRLIDVDDRHLVQMEDLFSVSLDSQGETLAYRNREWHRQRLIPVQSCEPSACLYRQNGVYVVIGGAGGIGEAWTEHMIRTYQAQVIWIGRRSKDEWIQAKLDRLAALGPEPIYIEADASKHTDLQRAYEQIKRRHAHIHGVIHSAIVLADQSLVNMEEDRFTQVYSVKADVCVQLAEVFEQETLDFVLFFSSIQSFARAPGQSNYSAGCSFKDAFAQRLSQEWSCPVKIMNWSYWGSVGIVASKEYQERMTQAGVGSIEPSEAMRTLDILLGSPLNQLVLMKTTAQATRETIDATEQVTVYPESSGVNLQNLRNNYKLGDQKKIQLIH
ncbi:Polyketide synthase PksN [compost metagenome]